MNTNWFKIQPILSQFHNWQDFMFKHSNKQHDTKSQEYSCILKQEASSMAVVMVTSITMKHFRNL